MGTPALWRLGTAGGRAADGGRSPLPSTTYPGFASLLTGARPERHLVRTTAHRDGAVPGWAGQRQAAVGTLLDACVGAGVPAAVVLGDHKLHRVLRVPEIPGWPPEGRLPAGTPLDSHGYPTNQAVRPHLLAAAADRSLRFLFGHLNEADTVGHDLGPEDPETSACYSATDAVIGELLETLAEEWTRTLVVVVSDHGMDRRSSGPPIDPSAAPGAAGLIEDWIGDGGAAWVRPRAGVPPETLAAALVRLDGVIGWSAPTADRVLVLAAPGRVFLGDEHPGGIHGGPGTERTVALVGGGHPAAAAIARAIEHRPPRLWDWAPTIAALLGVDLPDADGRDLLSGSEVD